MPDVYASNLASRVEQLEREVDQLKALLGTRPALTAASQGWLLTNQAVPDVDVGQVHIGANSGEFFAVGSSGVVRRLYPQAATVAAFTTLPSGTPDNVIATLGGTYDGSAINGNFLDVATKINAILTSLKNADHMNS
ncbi:hypothetical protein MF672_010930 [Actinomadura sp. ATCC 31491]|uniref:Flagellar hook-associated protein 1 n=1 Tax=Actinomadura luzonensis TaxID=2805427 RepID=A0ABT0FPM9_9ACTN|nr:hypothetical protein [Actinomadura luzonensis]MCK2214301.1 hypothetical protein [Actinomadura luzonensis]